MKPVLAIGVGCRAGTPASAIVALIDRARASVDAEADVKLFSIVDKASEPGLREAAAELGLEIAFLSHDEVTAVAARVLTASSASRERFELPSVSEATALAGAGPKAKLIVPRIAENGVTCAIAGPPGFGE